MQQERRAYEARGYRIEEDREIVVHFVLLLFGPAGSG